MHFVFLKECGVFLKKKLSVWMIVLFFVSVMAPWLSFEMYYNLKTIHYVSMPAVCICNC